MKLRCRILQVFVLALALVAILPAATASAADIAGCWSGQWISCKNGHHGPMTASLCKVDDEHYNATFRGRFWKIFPFRYRTMLHVKSDDGETVVLQGSMYLGRLFGTFSYTATVTESDFDAKFSSCRDWGKFVMKRCCSG